MNIFLTSLDCRVCAMEHNDKHLIKQILEYAQILCTCFRVLYGDALPPELDHTLYKKTHFNHPCTKWARTNVSTYLYLYSLWVQCSLEYMRRFKKTHKTFMRLKDVLKNPPKQLERGALVLPPQVVPDDCKRDSVTTAYQAYVNKHKSHLHKWTNTPPPSWIQ